VTTQDGEIPGAAARLSELAAEPGLAVLVTGDSSEAERELMLLDVGCEARAPALVRAALSEIRELDAIREDVILVAGELVTNAVVHSGGAATDTIRVRAVLIGGGVVISVDDPGLSDDAPQMQAADGSRVGGNGLRIVNHLAHRWRFERGRRHRVWAQLASGGARLG
jgi:anti-sigma regulatory factor (Ser/Thr protein kinase)